MPTPNLCALHQYLLQMASALGIDPVDFPPEFKTRDQTEPFLDEKQAAERSLFLVMQAFFAAQARRIRDAIQARAPRPICLTTIFGKRKICYCGHAW